MPLISLKNQLPFFKKVSLFENLDEVQINQLIRIMSVKEVKRGEMITVEGDHDDALFILIIGQVEISKQLLLPLWGKETKRQEKSLIRLSEKDHCFFGEMALLEKEPERSASIKALQPCTLAVLSKQDFLGVLESNPEIGSVVYKNIATELTRRLVKANKDILKLATAFSLALEGD